MPKGIPAAERRLRRDANAIAQAALRAADAGNAVRRHVQRRGSMLRVARRKLALANFDRVFILAVGKAAGSMAAVLEELIEGYLTAGLLVTKHGHPSSKSPRMTSLAAAHPVPDESGLQAAQHVQQLLRELNARDLLLVAVSGGASALLPAPAESLNLSDKQQTTNLLLQCGATIAELNVIRKHLSGLKGGRLAALAYPATVVGLLLSDVIGDDLSVIGSGLTAPDLSTFAEALAVFDRFHLLSSLPSAIRNYLETGAAGQRPETPKPGDPVFDNVYNVVVGNNRQALEAAHRAARKLGYRAAILSSTLSGETREAAAVHAAILREVRQYHSPLRSPACLLSGGETTVTIRGQGKGGRNQEFALAAALLLDGLENVLSLSLGTDGTDGPTDAAGAWATGTTAGRARTLGLDPEAHLARNDSYPLFAALEDLIHTGPTGTNVMDINLLLAG